MKTAVQERPGEEFDGLVCLQIDKVVVVGWVEQRENPTNSMVYNKMVGLVHPM